METRASSLWPATSSAKPNFGGGDSPKTAHIEQGLGRILWNMGMRPFLYPPPIRSQGSSPSQVLTLSRRTYTPTYLSKS